MQCAPSAPNGPNHLGFCRRGKEARRSSPDRAAGAGAAGGSRGAERRGRSKNKKSLMETGAQGSFFSPPIPPSPVCLSLGVRCDAAADVTRLCGPHANHQTPEPEVLTLRPKTDEEDSRRVLQGRGVLVRDSLHQAGRPKLGVGACVCSPHCRCHSGHCWRRTGGGDAEGGRSQALTSLSAIQGCGYMTVGRRG